MATSRDLPPRKQPRIGDFFRRSEPTSTGSDSSATSVNLPTSGLEVPADSATADGSDELELAEEGDGDERLTSFGGQEPSRSAGCSGEGGANTMPDSRGGDYGLIYMHVRDLSDDQKYTLLTKPFVPDSSFSFPVYVDSSGRKRSFQRSWLQTFPGLVYSPSVNGGFCKHCALFGKGQSGQSLGNLVSRPLTNLRKATEILRDHFFGKDGTGRLSHTHAVADAMTFVQHMEQRVQPIDMLLSTAAAKQIAENRLKLKSILKTVILCGRQNLSLRGHRDHSTSTSVNKGNFLALLEFRAEAGDSVLSKHFESASSRCTYTSKTIQNELIIVCGSYISEKIFSVIADEATDSANCEQLSMVLRFVDADMNIREEFLGFTECKDGVT